LSFSGTLRRCRLDLLVRVTDVAVVLVELGGIFQRRRLATRFDLVEDADCTISRVTVGRVALGGQGLS
jgi:hypothetical protein